MVPFLPVSNRQLDGKTAGRRAGIAGADASTPVVADAAAVSAGAEYTAERGPE